MRGVTIRQLQIFVTAAGRLSFARTSEQLHLTQAAVSLQIKQLETIAGLALFERRGRKLFLTDAGEHLLRYAQQILDALKDADAAISALKGMRGGRISVGVVSTAKYFAPALIAQFQRRYPGVRVSLSVNNREVIVRELERNDIDLAIMGTPPQRIETKAVPFADHPLVVIAPPAHPLAGARRIPLRALEGETFLVREQGSGTRSSMERFFAEHGFVPRIGNVMSSNETIKQAVMAGMGLALISRHTIGLELEARAAGRARRRRAAAHAPLVRRPSCRTVREPRDVGVRRFRRRDGAGRSSDRWFRARGRRLRGVARTRPAARRRARRAARSVERAPVVDARRR